MTIETAVDITLPVQEPIAQHPIAIPAAWRDRFPGLGLVMEWDDRDGPEVMHLSLRDIILDIERGDPHGEPNWDALATVDAIKDAMREVYGIPCRIYTREEYAERTRERERAELEEMAVAIARRYACTVYTERFLVACHAEIASIRGKRHSARCSNEPFLLPAIHECNESEAQILHLLNWIESHLPLLWARWEETRQSA